MAGDEDLDFAALVRKRPAIYFGDQGADSLIRMLALEAGSGFTGTLTVTLRADGSIRLGFGGEQAAAEYWQILSNAPDPPNLTGYHRSWPWSLIRVCCLHADLARTDSGFWLEFTPDYDMDLMSRPRAHQLAGWLSDLATTRPGMTVSLVDAFSDVRFGTSFPRGALDRLLLEAAGRRLNHSPLIFHGEANSVKYDAAFAWADGPGLQVVALVNGERTPAGGAHVKGIWQGLADAANIELTSRGLLQQDSRRVGALDLPRNCVLVVTVEMDSPKWGPATKDCLHSGRAQLVLREAVATSVVDQLGPTIMAAANPPWQLLAGVHQQDGVWLDRVPASLADLETGERWGATDPYFHHE